MHQQQEEFLTASEVAKRLSLTSVQVTRLYERGFLPPVPRFGRYRMIPAKDLDRIRQAAREAGYMK